MQEISELFHRYINNKCTPEEVRTLLKHFNVTDGSTELRNLIAQQLLQNPPENFDEQPDVIKAFDQSDIFLQQKLFKKPIIKRIYEGRLFKYAVAACFICLVSLWFYNKQKPEQKSIIQTVYADANPGTDKAFLTLADGTKVLLDVNNSNTTLNDKGISIRKTKDGMLVYEISSETGTENIIGFNELSTPKGAKYQVLLPDGTSVWLNAESTLKYPLVFAGDERKVELTGEAYFEVEKLTKNNKRIPFYVETRNQIIEVLGTEFNISAYNDDLAVVTTLVSGKVDVHERSKSNNVILSPGQQAISVEGSEMKVIPANLESTMAWKMGNFMYEDVYLKDILKQLSRWYNVTIDYSNLPHTRYNVLISRNEKLSAVLKMLEKTGNIKFQISNNTIQINP